MYLSQSSRLILFYRKHSHAQTYVQVLYHALAVSFSVSIFLKVVLDSTLLHREFLNFINSIRSKSSRIPFDCLL